MYVIRDVMNCKPGKVGEMVKKFKAMSPVLEKHGQSSMRVMTDVAGEPYWTVVGEFEVPSLEKFQELMSASMSDPEGRKAMEGYHELVMTGRREIFKIED